jgi:hypothetical protein
MKKSHAQQAALKRFIHSKVAFKDFSMAQGYATCYAERVTPLVEALKAIEGETLSKSSREKIEALLRDNPIG